MPENKDYISNVHASLSKNVEGFNRSEDEFRSKMTDPEYAKKVHASLAKNVQGFARTEDDFLDKVGLKKKDDTGQSSTILTKPSVPSGESKSFTEKIAGNDLPKTATKPQPKEFESRIANPSLYIQNEDGSKSTHKMSSAEVDGKQIAYPTIVNKGGKLQELSSDEAIDHALKTGEYKEFKTEKEAQQYADGGYKKGTPLENHDAYLKSTNEIGLPKAPEFKTKGQGVLEQPTKELPSNILEAAPPRNIAEKPVQTTSMKAVEDAIETTKTAWKALHKGWKQGELSAKFNETLESGQIAKWNPHYKEDHAKDLEELASISNDVDKIHQTKGVQDFENAEHGHKSWEAFKKNPVDVLTSIILTSGASLLSSTLNEKASSSNSPVEMPMVNPAQLMAEKGYNLGMASDMMASLHEAGVDLKNPKSIKSALEDENKIAEIYKKANDRNVPIAIVDMMTGTLASKIVGKMAKTAMPTILNRAKQIATGSAIETTGAMGGEGLAQVNSEGKITSIQDILLEGAGELGQGAPNIATGIFANEDGAVQVQEPTQQSTTSTEGAQPSDAITQQQESVVQPTNPDANKGTTIESAVIEIGGETFEGKNHAEAILKAQQAGKDISQVDRKGEGMFKLSDGTVISRNEAKATFGADKAEMLIPQDENAIQADKEYNKIKKQQGNGQVPVDETGKVGAVVQGTESVGRKEGAGAEPTGEGTPSTVKEENFLDHPLFADVKAHHDIGIDLVHDRQALAIERSRLVSKKQPTDAIDSQISAKDFEIESHVKQGDNLLAQAHGKVAGTIGLEVLNNRDVADFRTIVLGQDFTNNASNIAAQRLSEQNATQNDTPQQIPNQASSNTVDENGTPIVAGTKVSDSVHPNEQNVQETTEQQLNDTEKIPTSVLDKPRSKNPKTKKGVEQVDEEYEQALDFFKKRKESRKLSPEEIKARKANSKNVKEERADRKKVRELEPQTARQAARKYLLGGGKLSKESIQSDGGLKNHNDHKHLSDIFTSFKKGTKFPSIQQAAHNILSDNDNLQEAGVTHQDVRNELIDLINGDRSNWHEDQKAELDPEYIQSKYEESQIPDASDYEKLGFKEPNDEVAQEDFDFQYELSDLEQKELNNLFYDNETFDAENSTSKGKSNSEGNRADQGKHADRNERNDSRTSTEGESIQERFGDTSKSGTELVAEITSKPLTRVEGLNMGQSQARGTYVSTEKTNRYETSDKKAKKATVRLKNPFVFKSESGIHHFRNAIIKEELEKVNSSFDETDFSDYKIPDPWNNTTIDNLSDSGIAKLAGLVSDKLIAEGFDSIYWDESKTQEGELVVFDKKNIQLEKELSAIDEIALALEGIASNLGATKNLNPSDKKLMDNLKALARGINRLTGEVGQELMDALSKKLKDKFGEGKLSKEIYDYKDQILEGIEPPNTPPKSEPKPKSKVPVPSKFSERTIDTKVFSTLTDDQKVEYEQIFNKDTIQNGKDWFNNNGHDLLGALNRSIQASEESLPIQSAAMQYILGLETQILASQAEIDAMNPDDVTNDHLRNIENMQKQQATILAKVSLLGTSAGRSVQLLGAGLSMMKKNPQYMYLATMEELALVTEAHKEHLTNPLSEEESVEMADIVDEAKSEVERDKDKQIEILKKQLEDLKARKTQKAVKEQSPESQEAKAKKEARIAEGNALKAALKAAWKGDKNTLNSGVNPAIPELVALAKFHIKNGAYDFATFSRRLGKDIVEVVGSGFDKGVIKNLWHESNLGLEQDLMDKIKAREEFLIAKKAQQIAQRRLDQEAATITKLEKQLEFATENLKLVEKGFDKLTPEKKVSVQRKMSEQAQALKIEIADVHEQIKKLEDVKKAKSKTKESVQEKESKAQDSLDKKITALHQKLKQAEKELKLSVTGDYQNPDKKESVKKELSAVEDLLNERIEKAKQKRAENLKIKKKLDALVNPKPRKKPSGLFEKISQALDDGTSDPMGDLDVRMAYAKHVSGNKITTEQGNAIKKILQKRNELSANNGSALEQAELWDEMMDIIASASEYTAYDKFGYNWAGNALSNPMGVAQNTWQSLMLVPSTYVRLWQTGNFKLANKVFADAWDKSMVESAYALATGSDLKSTLGNEQTSMNAIRKRAIEAKLWDKATNGNIGARSFAKAQIMQQQILLMNSQANVVSRGIRDRATFMTAMIKQAQRDNRKLPEAQRKSKQAIAEEVSNMIFQNNLKAYDEAFKAASERLGLTEVGKRTTAIENAKMFLGQVPSVFNGKQRSAKDITDIQRIHVEAVNAVSNYNVIHHTEFMNIAEHIGDMLDLKNVPQDLDFNGERKTGITNAFVDAINSLNSKLQKKAADNKDNLVVQTGTIIGGSVLKTVAAFPAIMVNWAKQSLDYVPVVAPVRLYNKANKMRNIDGAPVKNFSAKGLESLWSPFYASDSYKESLGDVEREMAFDRMRSKAITGTALTITAIAALSMFEGEDDPEKRKKQKFWIHLNGNGAGVPDDIHEAWKKVGGGEQRLIISHNGHETIIPINQHQISLALYSVLGAYNFAKYKTFDPNYDPTEETTLLGNSAALATNFSISTMKTLTSPQVSFGTRKLVESLGYMVAHKYDKAMANFGQLSVMMASSAVPAGRADNIMPLLRYATEDNKTRPFGYWTDQAKAYIPYLQGDILRSKGYNKKADSQLERFAQVRQDYDLFSGANKEAANAKTSMMVSNLDKMNFGDHIYAMLGGKIQKGIDERWKEESGLLDLYSFVSSVGVKVKDKQNTKEYYLVRPEGYDVDGKQNTDTEGKILEIPQSQMYDINLRAKEEFNRISIENYQEDRKTYDNYDGDFQEKAKKMSRMYRERYNTLFDEAREEYGLEKASKE